MKRKIDTIKGKRLVVGGALDSQNLMYNIKYFTNTNNYLEYFNRYSSETEFKGRHLINKGKGPNLDIDYPQSADGYRHSSGVVIGVLETY